MKSKSNKVVGLVVLLTGFAGEAWQSKLKAADAIFPPGSVGQALEQRLTPPRNMPVPALPASAGLQSRILPTLEKSPLRPAAVASAEIPRTPIALRDQQPKIHWMHAALDRPWLAAERDPARPLVPTLAVSTPAYVAVVDPKKAATLPRFAELTELRPTISDDPTALTAREVVVTPTAVPAPVPPAVIRFSIPDPYEHLRWARLKEVPPDNDPPAASLVRPVRPKLEPVQPE